jgi:hypothetical protein
MRRIHILYALILHLGNDVVSFSPVQRHHIDQWKRRSVVQLAGILEQQQGKKKDNNINASGESNNEVLHPTNPTDDELPTQQQQRWPFITMYTLVPFVPPILLCTLNDEYLAAKSTFTNYASSLTPNVLPDSLEYITAAAMYYESMRSLFVLLATKRLALYFIATATTVYAGWRASSTGVLSMKLGSYSGPGDALDGLNREILSGERQVTTSRSSSSVSDFVDDDKLQISKADDADIIPPRLFAAIVDDGPTSSKDVGTRLALALPLILGASLTLSYLLSTSSFFDISQVDMLSSNNNDIENVILEVLTSLLPTLSMLPGAILSLLFVATEFRWAVPDGGVNGQLSAPPQHHPLVCWGNVLALFYVIGAYIAKIYPTLTIGTVKLDLWPLQNGVNIALAATVARALSLFLLSSSVIVSPEHPDSSIAIDSVLSASSSPSSVTGGKKSIRTVALALVGLTIFDAIATFGTVANASINSVDINDASSTISVMEAVAQSKLASWQPGLLEVIIGHDNTKVTEALGLGDVVFPSILVAWGFMADDDNKEDTAIGYSSYASASVIGYIIGSFITEIVGSFDLLGIRSGLPALVFLIPSMLVAVTLMAWSRNELRDVFG